MCLARRAPLIVAISSSILLVCGLCATARAADVETPHRPKVSGATLKNEPFSGRALSYNDDGFELLVKENVTQTIAWKDVDAKTRYAVGRQLIDPKDAAAHVELGKALVGREGGREYADKAFGIALKLDPALKSDVEKIKQDAASAPASGGKGDEGKKGDAAANEGEGGGMGAEAEDHGPKVVGGVQEQFWKELTPEQHASAVAELKAFAEKTQATMKKQLQLEETEYFLFYSDLPAAEAKKWAGLLDRMQGKLAELFATSAKIWRGKALVFVFRSQTDYARFQMQMHGTDATGTRGMCHSYGNGMVHIAFVRQANELEFAHVLVHESVHGFLHRFMTPVNIPSWANEGLAEWIANELVPRPARAKVVKTVAKSQIQIHKGVGGMFEAQHIEGWQYPVAEMLTTFMIERNKRRYVDFIIGIKQGLTWEESLEQKYQMTRKKLLQDFGAGMGV